MITTVYNSTKARKLFYTARKINDETFRKCDNPCCNNFDYAKNMELHHTWSREIAPALTYVVSNMALICSTCHNALHRGWKMYYALLGEKKKKSKSLSKNIRLDEYEIPKKTEIDNLPIF